MSVELNFGDETRSENIFFMKISINVRTVNATYFIFFATTVMKMVLAYTYTRHARKNQ